VIPVLKQGEIWLADLNPGKGSEPGKTRPVLIVQGQALLDAEHPSTLIVPLTTKLTEDAEPLRIRVTAHRKLKHNSDLLIDQLRAIDNRRFTEGPLMLCDEQLMARVYGAIRDVLEM
jgi:mRNA interferase MazF